MLVFQLLCSKSCLPHRRDCTCNDYLLRRLFSSALRELALASKSCIILKLTSKNRKSSTRLIYRFPISTCCLSRRLPRLSLCSCSSWRLRLDEALLCASTDMSRLSEEIYDIRHGSHLILFISWYGTVSGVVRCRFLVFKLRQHCEMF